MCNVDILLSEEAPESDYEYVNPVHVVLIDDDKDDIDTTSSSSPPLPRSTTNNNNSSSTSGNIASRSKQTTNAPPRSAPATGSGSSLIKSKPISLPPMPTLTQTTAAGKRRGPLVPPRKQVSASDRLRGLRLDRDGYLDCMIMPSVSNEAFDDDDDDDDDCRSEPIVQQDVQDGRSSHRWQPVVRRRRANSVDSLLDWQPVATSFNHSNSHDAPRPTSRRPSTPLKFRGDLGLVPTNIASLSVEEVNVCGRYTVIYSFVYLNQSTKIHNLITRKTHTHTHLNSSLLLIKTTSWCKNSAGLVEIIKSRATYSSTARLNL